MRSGRSRRSALIADALTVLTLVALAATTPVASAAPAVASAASDSEEALLDSLLTEAMEAVESGELDRGRTLCEEALDISKDAHRAHWGLAIIALNEDDADEAVKQARRAVKGEEDNVEYRMTLADAYGAKAMQGGLRSMMYGGRYKDELEKVLELDPEHIGAHFGLLYYCIYAPGVAGGGMDAAWERAEIIAGIDDFHGHQARAVLAKRGKDFATADREYLAAAHVDTTRVDGWIVLGSYYLETERPELAVEPLERALAMAPDNLVTVYQLAKAQYRSGSDLLAAEEGFRECLTAGRVPGGPPPASAHWRLGQVLEAQGRTVEAMVEYDMAISLDPEHEPAMEAKSELEARMEEVSGRDEAKEDGADGVDASAE